MEAMKHNSKEVARMKRLFCLLALFCLGLCLPVIGFAQELSLDPALPPATELGWLAALLTGLASKYTWLVAVLSVVGLLRLIVKPMVTIVETVVVWTTTTTDDEWLVRVKGGRVYRLVMWILDWLCSIKVPGQSTNPLLKN